MQFHPQDVKMGCISPARATTSDRGGWYFDTQNLTTEYVHIHPNFIGGWETWSKGVRQFNSLDEMKEYFIEAIINEVERGDLRFYPEMEARKLKIIRGIVTQEVILSCHNNPEAVEVVEKEIREKIRNDRDLILLYEALYSLEKEFSSQLDFHYTGWELKRKEAPHGISLTLMGGGGEETFIIGNDEAIYHIIPHYNYEGNKYCKKYIISIENGFTKASLEGKKKAVLEVKELL